MNNKGFSLVEMAVVVMVAGILMAATIAIILPLVETTRNLETKEKMAKISDYLSNYAVLNYRLPCPAEPRSAPVTEPYGFEDGSGANGDVIPSPGCTVTQGIVPFQTLGMPEDMVVDGWGNYFTYAVSPSFAQDTATGNPADIHPVCRTREWLYVSRVDTGGESVIENRNPQKARFCCPGPIAGDIDVLDEDGNNVLAVARNPGPDGYQPPDVLMEPAAPAALNSATCAGTTLAPSDAGYFEAPQVPPACARATTVAFVILSHGANGLGVYDLSTGNRLNVPAAGSVEGENADDDAQFRDHVERRDGGAAATQIDDVMVWRTQDLVYASQGETCVLP